MSVSLVLPQSLYEEIRSVAEQSAETAGVMLVGVATGWNGTVRLLARHIRWVAESAYIRRDWDGMVIRPEGYVRSLAEAEIIGATCIWVHTHPGQGASPQPSEHDRIVDREIADLFRLRSGSPYYGTLIFSPRSSNIAFTGYVARDDSRPVRIERLWQVGDRWQLRRSFDSSLPPLSPLHVGAPLLVSFPR